MHDSTKHLSFIHHIFLIELSVWILFDIIRRISCGSSNDFIQHDGFN